MALLAMPGDVCETAAMTPSVAADAMSLNVILAFLTDGRCEDGTRVPRVNIDFSESGAML